MCSNFEAAISSTRVIQSLPKNWIGHVVEGLLLPPGATTRLSFGSSVPRRSDAQLSSVLVMLLGSRLEEVVHACTDACSAIVEAWIIASSQSRAATRER
jgi:hypothetical protein